MVFTKDEAYELNIDNNEKYFLRSKSVYQNDFWRIGWRNDAENSLE